MCATTPNEAVAYLHFLREELQAQETGARGLGREYKVYMAGCK